MQQRVSHGPLRVAFLGRGTLGRLVLGELVRNSQIQVPIIVTCRHTPEVGIGPGVFESIAAENRIPYYQANNLNQPEWVERFNSLNLDLAVAMLWVHTIAAPIIRTSRLGFLNCHAGLLPKYRGNACSNWAILNGEVEHGVTVHLMEPDRLDSGPIVLQEKVFLTPDTTVRRVTDELTTRGAVLVVKAVELFRLNQANPVPQDEAEAMYCYPRLPRDGEIDWTKPAEDILRLIRAVSDPYPGAYSYFADVTDANRIKKMVIDAASIEESPRRLCAVPGHLIRLEDGAKWGIVCGDHKFLILREVRIDGRQVRPEAFFRTVRQRFGLDTETLVREIQQYRVMDEVR